MNQHLKIVRVSTIRPVVRSLAVMILACVPNPSLAADDIVLLASSGTLAISNVSASSPQVACYETVEITFRLEGQWQNPFDPDEVRVDAIFTAPDGGQASVPGFFYQEYNRSVSDGRESYRPWGGLAGKDASRRCRRERTRAL